MAEYKDITTLKKEIADFKKAVNSPNSDYMTGYICALSATEGIIASLPNADVVEVRHGYWKDNQNGTFTCSECEGKSSKMDWCGRCGAKMDGETNK